jgi:hypothetical protein
VLDDGPDQAFVAAAQRAAGTGVPMSRREHPDFTSPGAPRRTAAGVSPIGRAERSRLAVRLTPRASRNAIEGFVRDADGRGEETLQVRVTAPPKNTTR